MLEVELKARLQDPVATEGRVRLFAKRVREFDKADSYWHGPEWRIARGTKGFRLREDGGRNIVTYKTKRNEGGIEINRETEFEVSDPAAFIGFLERIGCEPFYEKRKKGVAYERDGYLIELVEVAGLGHFIEIERLLPGDDPEAIALALGGLKETLAMAGVPEADIEGRSYSELIVMGNQA